MEEIGTDGYFVTIMSDGTVVWNYPKVTIGHCRINVHNFPFDRQYCKLLYGSWAFTSSKLNIMNKSAHGDTSSYVENAEWDLVDVQVERHEIFYACCTESFVDVTFTIVIDRRPLYYWFNLVIPCLFMIAIVLVGLYLPVESGEKIGLSVTIILALTVFLQLVSEKLPTQAESIPLISKYRDFNCM